MYFDTKSAQECCGCGACQEVCPRGAISFQEDASGALLPQIDSELCVSCGKCRAVCAFRAVSREESPRAFIAAGRDAELCERSTSGGIFAVLARKCLEKGGAVFGAAIEREEEGLVCRHICVTDERDLEKLQGSKYVRSLTAGIFSRVREAAESGKPVLFSGTSCQVAALYSFLGRSYENLFTTDLVCHGVPEILLLQRYVDRLENERHYTVEDIAFRSKRHPAFREKQDSYNLTVQYRDPESGEEGVEYTDKSKSPYYRLFLAKASYRPNCYACPFASPDKPADITLGDFRPSAAETERYGLDRGRVYSSVFVHSAKGEMMFGEIRDECDAVPMEMKDMLPHHPNLRGPSVMSERGAKMAAIYRKKGFDGVQKYADRLAGLQKLAGFLPGRKRRK